MNRVYIANLKNSALFHRLLEGFGWSFSGVVLGRLATLLASVAVARVLGRASYGEFALLQSTATMLAELGGLGVGVAAAKWCGQYRTSDPFKASGLLTLNLIAPLGLATFLSFLLWLGREWLADEVFHDPDIAPLLTYVAISLLFASISGVVGGLLSGLEQFRLASLQQLLVSVVSSVGQMGLVSWYGIEGVLLATVIANASGAVLGLFLLRQTLPKVGLVLNLMSARRESRSLITLNLPAMLSAMLVVPVTWASGVILVRQPEGYSEMAAFNIANQWKMALLIAPTVIGNVLLPTLSRLAVNDNRNKYHQAIKLQLLANAFASVAFVVPMCLLSPYILDLYGPNYDDDVMVMWLLIVVAGLMTFNAPIGNSLTSSGYLWVGLAMNAAWAVSVLLLAAWYCPRMGAVGLALSYLLAYVAHTCWQSFALYYFVFSGRSLR